MTEFGIQNGRIQKKQGACGAGHSEFCVLNSVFFIENVRRNQVRTGPNEMGKFTCS